MSASSRESSYTPPAGGKASERAPRAPRERRCNGQNKPGSSRCEGGGNNDATTQSLWRAQPKPPMLIRCCLHSKTNVDQQKRRTSNKHTSTAVGSVAQSTESSLKCWSGVPKRCHDHDRKREKTGRRINTSALGFGFPARRATELPVFFFSLAQVFCLTGFLNVPAETMSGLLCWEAVWCDDAVGFTGHHHSV